MKKVIFTVGLPASGKTTWSKDQIKRVPHGQVKRVNKDDLRAMIDNNTYTSENEQEINRVLKLIIFQYLQHTSVHTVIVDGCNLTKHIKDVTEYIKEHTEQWEHSVTFDTKIFEVSPQQCLEWNKQRLNPLPDKVIWNMLFRYQQEARFTSWEQEGEIFPRWIGFDLDGTLAFYDGWRGPDHIGDPIPNMMRILKNYLSENQKVKIFTARACIPEQVPPIRKWLIEHELGGLEITNIKDFGMILLYDDRCKQVIPNTGELVEVCGS